MKKRIENNSYKYAKRQITWFKRNKSIHWIKEKDEAIDLIQKVFELVSIYSPKTFLKTPTAFLGSACPLLFAITCPH